MPMSGSGPEDGERTLAITPRAAARAAAAVEIGHYLAFAEAGGLRRVAIGAGGLTLGRQPPADIVIGQPEISRRHCRVHAEREWAVVTDLGSTNGTYVRDRRIDRPTRIGHGGSFSLGSFPVRYERRDRREVADAESLAAEIRRAADYVRAILPPPLADGPIRTDWWFVPSATLGGDAFGYQFLDADTFAGFVLDVSGHGIGSALHAANVANVIRRKALPGVDFADPAQVAAGLNAMFPMEHHNGLMLTLWYFVHHLPTRLLRFCAAGHHPSYLGGPDIGDPLPLWLRGPAIGMLPRGTWAAGRVEIPRDSRMYVFSDGAFEIVAGNGQQWVIDDLRRIMRGPASPHPSEAERIYQAVRAAARPGPLEDDFSVLVVRFA